MITSIILFTEALWRQKIVCLGQEVSNASFRAHYWIWETKSDYNKEKFGVFSKYSHHWLSLPKSIQHHFAIAGNRRKKEARCRLDQLAFVTVGRNTHLDFGCNLHILALFINHSDPSGFSVIKWDNMHVNHCRLLQQMVVFVFVLTNWWTVELSLYPEWTSHSCLLPTIESSVIAVIAPSP